MKLEAGDATRGLLPNAAIADGEANVVELKRRLMAKRDVKRRDRLMQACKHESG